MARNNTLDPAAVGARLRERRLMLGLSQRDLAIDGVSYAYVSRVEGATRSPSLSALINIAAKMREMAAEQADALEAVDGLDKDGRKYLAALRHAATETTALWLLTGSTHDPCPFCGRPDPGGGTNGKRKRKSR